MENFGEMIQAEPMNHVIINKQHKPFTIMFRCYFFQPLIDSDPNGEFLGPKILQPREF